jgi:NDP-sugar pyrophosphorylase family protein
MEKTKALLLVGGLGTRLQPVVASTAKPMAPVGGRPFLELLLKQLSSQGFREIVLCTGYRAEDLESQLQDGRDWNVRIEYSHELSPMGTAGALKFAEPYLKERHDFIVMNGDSFMELDLQDLVDAHHRFGGVATVAIVRRQNVMRYGTVQVDAHHRVTGFLEKSASGSGEGLINAGVYVFSTKIFDLIPEGCSSLERDTFPKALAEGVYAVEQHGMFLDIGTPEDYALAQMRVSDLRGAAARTWAPGTTGGKSIEGSLPEER